MEVFNLKIIQIECRCDISIYITLLSTTGRMCFFFSMVFSEEFQGISSNSRINNVIKNVTDTISFSEKTLIAEPYFLKTNIHVEGI